MSSSLVLRPRRVPIARKELGGWLRRVGTSSWWARSERSAFELSRPRRALEITRMRPIGAANPSGPVCCLRHRAASFAGLLGMAEDAHYVDARCDPSPRHVVAQYSREDGCSGGALFASDGDPFTVDLEYARGAEQL